MAKHTTFAAWDNTPHLSESAKAEMISAYMPHERDARTKGIPSLGSGAIYPVSEDDILCDPFEFPAWYRHCYGMDVGWNKTAAIWGALDPEDSCLYLYAEYYRGQAEPAVHAAAIRGRGEWIPGVIDPAARGRGQSDGEQLLHAYTGLGLTGLTLANNAVEAGIYAVWERLSTGRLRVFRTLQNFRTEYRIYRRDEKGKIIKEMDHLMDACRYLCMSGVDRAMSRPVEQWAGRPGTPKGVQPRFESEYKPFAQQYGQATKQDTRQSWTGIGSWR
jgi:hypothetical protein